MKLYIVTRNCCTSGNCDRCSGVTPFGKCLRVQQLRTLDKKLAERCKRNFNRDGYNAVLNKIEISDESEIHNYQQPVPA